MDGSIGAIVIGQRCLGKSQLGTGAFTKQLGASSAYRLFNFQALSSREVDTTADFFFASLACASASGACASLSVGLWTTALSG